MRGQRVEFMEFAKEGGREDEPGERPACRRNAAGGSLARADAQHNQRH